MTCDSMKFDTKIYTNLVTMECPFPSTTRDSGMRLMNVQSRGVILCGSMC